MNTFVAGYMLVWFSLSMYVGWIARRQRRLAARYETLRRQLEADESQDRPLSAAA